MADDRNDELVIFHPNREKATSQLMKFLVVLLLLASAALVLIVTLGGWSSLQGQQIVSLAYVIVYVTMAYYVARWRRGLLPLAAALAIVLGVFAVLAAPEWFSRSHGGFDNPGLPPDLIGTLCLLLIPVSLLLIVVGMFAFSQKWNIEVEMTREQADRERKKISGENQRGGRRPRPRMGS
jgi:lysylphosphatidylglycerol synthetase-like protein (DUF2156 family)